MSDTGLAPYARGLRAFFDGDEATVLRVRRDDGLVMPLPVRHFFRPAAELTPIERLALRACRGPVLDVGA
ncbi:MAG: hypothetical protein GWM90_28005, partial [Gemmatimonadetes bacterium]|nr:hypothetical protein [Gemmatimonadota bacterium]NIQ58867.1 hypothetical protein [Gemmatimonadota bacterium]NIU79037.1 hypothetical protein [Gammaproteobacteria bacterium]NIX47773.1 hypothetical protein [Gemmatimonadota bacterium]NIY12134.1 hypothetical protein [Gemmatimonadota bacterium]